ncbi:MAG TPA: methyltransferase domain-containing protein [Chloroflexota bacterium]
MRRELQHGPRVSPHEFAAVDEARDPGMLVRYLDMMSAAEDLKQIKRQTYALLELQPGHRVLDVGCGTGEDVRTMARIVGPTGHVVGLDSSSTVIEVAAARTASEDLPCEFRIGQAEMLDLEDGSFDACRAERVLQHVANPGQAIAEMIRVLRPGGHIVCFEPDWDLQVFDAPDRDLTRRICRFRADRMQSGNVGRQLRRHFIAGGLIDVRVVPLPGVITELRIADTAMRLQGGLEEAVGSEVVTAEEARHWWKELEDADRAGQFFAASVAFLVSGRKSPSDTGR